MSIDLFQEKFANYFSKTGYQFLTPELRPEDLKWPTPEQIKKISYHEKTAYPEIRGIGRLLGLASAPSTSITILEKFLSTLLTMQKHGEFVGFSFGSGMMDNGAPKILLVMDSENLNDEQILGRFILIRDAAQNFRDFALTPFGQGRWSKQPTTCNVFMVFSSHTKATHFSENLEGKCKHYNILTKAPHIFPWTVDLERKRVKKYSGFPPSIFKEDALEKSFFD